MTITRSRSRTAAAVLASSFALGLAAAMPGHAQQTIQLTAIDGYPPQALWIKEFINFYIPEVDKRLAKDNKYKIRWNQAWGGQIVKPTGVLEGLQKGLGDIGIVTTAIYGDKMKVIAVAYMTPFTTTDPLLVAQTIDELAAKFPAIKKTFASYNQVFLSAQVVLDSYQMFSKTEAKALQDYKGMKIASAAPIADPTSTAIAIHRMSTIWAWISVPVTAAAIPTSPALIPLRAVVGWVSHLSARTKPTLAIR